MSLEICCELFHLIYADFVSEVVADHGLAKLVGLHSAWIDREEQEDVLKGMRDRVDSTWRYKTLGEMAEDMRNEFQNSKYAVFPCNRIHRYVSHYYMQKFPRNPSACRIQDLPTKVDALQHAPYMQKCLPAALITPKSWYQNGCYIFPAL